MHNEDRNLPTAIIEINDAGLRAAIGDEIILSSPGYAVMDGDRLLIGEEAFRNARLLPRWTNNQFWNQLGTEPISNGSEMVRHNADIAFMHLEQVWRQIGDRAHEVIIAVPGFYSRAQLGLLLGMAKECDMPVAGLVDTSLVSVCDLPAHRKILHLDIFLHRITLTILNADTSLHHEATFTVSETGLFTLWDRWANIVANQFIQTSRYDPMHQAVSEQKLFDKLPDWIASLGRERSAHFELTLGTTRHSVAISREQLLAACAAVYPQIVQIIRDKAPAGDTVSLFVSHRFQGFPGFDDSLRLINNVDLVHLTPESVFAGAAVAQDKIISSGKGITHVTSLPITLARPTTSQAQSARRATHVLIDHHAVAIGRTLRLGISPAGDITTDAESPQCTVYIRGNQAILDNQAGDTVSLNGEIALPRGELHPGDKITIEGQVLTLISAD